jgi:hypothetical protein
LLVVGGLQTCPCLTYFADLKGTKMNNVKGYILTAIGVVIVCCGFVLSVPNTGHSAPPTDKDVRVINTPTEAVPTRAQGTTNVAGAVSITNTPTVNAQQSGAWNVGLTGSPTVQVGNDAANPVLVRDVDRPTAQPFEQQVEVTIPDGNGGENAGFLVPLGKLLVIEQVSARGNAPSGQRLNFSILSRVLPDLTLRFHHLTRVQDEDSPTTFLVQSQQVRIYVDGSFAVRIDRNGSTGTATAVFVVTGHLINK